MWAALLNRDPSLFYESGRAAWRFDSRPWVGEITTPTMVIIPSVDQIVPVRAQRDLAGRIGAEKVIVIEGSGHESILARPDEYVTAITDFLTEPLPPLDAPGFSAHMDPVTPGSHGEPSSGTPG